MADTVEEVQAITDVVAAQPKQVAVDGVSTTGQNIPDLIELENHRSAQAAARSRSAPFRTFQTKPPGAV